MQTVGRDLLVNKAVSLLENGTVQLVLGWRKGLFDYDITPATFTAAEDIIRNFEWNDHCGANLSKYLVKLSRKAEGKILGVLGILIAIPFAAIVTFTLNEIIIPKLEERKKNIEKDAKNK